jgi:hypothetical protein
MAGDCLPVKFLKGKNLLDLLKPNLVYLAVYQVKFFRGIRS